MEERAFTNREKAYLVQALQNQVSAERMSSIGENVLVWLQEKAGSDEAKEFIENRMKDAIKKDSFLELMVDMIMADQVVIKTHSIIPET